MKDAHLDEETLEALVRETDSPAARRALLHLLAVCSDCYGVGGYLLDAYRSGELPLHFSALEAELARSRAQAPTIWANLEGYPFSRQSGLVEASDRFVTWGLCELLSRESEKVAPKDPKKAVEIARLAVRIAERLLPGQPAEEAWLQELRAYALAFLGNARRALGELTSADEAFDQAEQLWARGAAEIEDPLGYGPVILDLKASLRRGQRRFGEALALLDRVFDHYRSRQAPDLHLAGRALVKKSYTLDQMGDPEQALATMREAEPLVDPERDPRLMLCVRHNVMWYLTTLGRFTEAQDLWPAVSELSERIGNRLDLVRLRWAEARIAAGLGDRSRGEALFQEVREAFVAEGIGYDAALASLELAVLYAEEGRTADLKRLAEEMLPIFQAQDVHREAFAALTLFQQAAAREEISVELVRKVAAYLDRARHDPGIKLIGEDPATRA